MKFNKIISIYILILTLSSSVFGQINSTLSIGEIMPMQNKKLTNVNGNDMTLSDNIKMNGILIVFTCNNCPFVVMWEDRYSLLEKKCRENNLGMIYINSNQAKRDGEDSPIEMKKHAEKMEYSFPYLIDINSEVANSFGAKTTPHIFLFNKNKKLSYKGAIDDNYKSLDDVISNYALDAIEELSQNQEISLSETKAVGCSIKRVKK